MEHSLFVFLTDSATSADTGSSSADTGQVSNPSNFFMEMWDKIVDFFKVNGVNLLLKILVALLIVIVVHYILKLTKFIIFKVLNRPRKKKGLDLEPMDPSIIYFIQSVTSFVIWTLVIFLILKLFDFDLNSLSTILAGAVAGVSLSLQSLISNFAYGVVLISSHVMKAGDYVIGENFEGTVKSVSMLFTTLESIDGKTVRVPNSLMATAPFSNASDVPVRNLRINFRVAPTADVAMLREILVEAAKDEPRVIETDPIMLVITDMTETSIGLSLRMNVKNGDYWDVTFLLNEKIVNTLKEKGISFAQNTLSLTTYSATVQHTNDNSSNNG